MDRRRFLQTGLTLTALPVLPAIAESGNEPSTPPESFSAFLDTLLPHDDHGPAASELGIVEPAWTGLTALPSDHTFVQDACRWLDRQAGGRFHSLTPSLRARLVSWMMQRPSGEAPALFYSRVRDRAVMLYYRHPRIQARLGQTHPPQPRGYTDDLMQYVAHHDS